MAVAVPIIMSAAGASAATTLITSVALAATGINDKINKAASKVFGEDVVQFGNLLGAGFMAFGGGGLGFGGESAAAGLDAAYMDMGNSIAGAGPAGLDAASIAQAGSGVTGPAAPATSADGVLAQVGGALGKTGKFVADQWQTMSPATKSLLGNMAAGAAQGYAEASRDKDERRFRGERTRGSGLRYGTDYRYGPGNGG